LFFVLSLDSYCTPACPTQETVAMSCIFCEVVHLIIMNFVVRLYPCVFLFTGGCNTLLACSLSSSYSAEIAKKLAIDFTNNLSSISLDSPFHISIHLCSSNILVILKTLSYSQKNVRVKICLLCTHKYIL
jgi:hypothetical protein